MWILTPLSILKLFLRLVKAIGKTITEYCLVHIISEKKTFLTAPYIVSA